jgi:hypothetical protein
MRRSRLTCSNLDFQVDVTVHEHDGRYMAIADLAEDSRDVGVGNTPQEAARAALRSLGEPYASEMAEATSRIFAGSCSPTRRIRNSRPGSAPPAS